MITVLGKGTVFRKANQTNFLIEESKQILLDLQDIIKYTSMLLYQDVTWLIASLVWLVYEATV